jgi:hypothetical protein
MRVGSLVILAVLLCTGAGSSKAPAPDLRMPKDDSGRYILQDVVQAEGISAEELFARARAWVAQTYRSANDVVQLEDKATGRLVAKGFDHLEGMLYSADVWHTLTIEIKEGRWRYTMTNFDARGPQFDMPLEKYSIGKMHEKAATSARAVVEDLKTAMQKPTPAASADW